MIFNKHSEIEGSHAILSPSGYSWLNYESEEDFFRRFKSSYAQAIGTALHEFARKCIERKRRLNKSHRDLAIFYLQDAGIPRSVIDPNDWFDTVAAYVNDAIGFKMTPEVPLLYSANAYGTTDAIAFKSNVLRIHDLKTGITPAKMDQLILYAAYFCLEYHYKPKDLETHLRIYQSNEVLEYDPPVDDIQIAITKTIEADKVISKFRE